MDRLLSTIAVAAGLVLAADPVGAQVVEIPSDAGRKPTWVSLSGGLYDMQDFHGGDDGGYWSWGDGVQLRGSIERSIRRDMTVGLTGGFARLPLTNSGGACSGCEGDATIWQAMGTLRLGGGGTIGFHSVFEASAGAAGFANIERGTDPLSFPGNVTTPEHDVVPAFSAAYGAGYTLTRGLEISLVQEIGIFMYEPADAAPSSAGSTPRFRSTRLTLRYALGRR